MPERRLRILMVWDGDYPWDVRVEKVCTTLIASGHEVHLVCRNSLGKPRREDIGGIHVRRVFSLGPRWPRLNALLTFPAFFSPIWLFEVRAAVNQINPDLVIIRDLPIALACIPFARRKKIPLVLDMAECYPEMLRCAWKFEGFRPANVLVRNPWLADQIERIAMRNLDMVWVMIGESAVRLEAMGVPASKVRIVSNTPVDIGVPPARNTRSTDGVLRVVYVGLINPSRGLRTVMEAARLLRDMGRKFEIKVAGSGKDFQHISSMVERFGLQKEVQLLGWIDHQRLSEVLANADVGLVPHYVCSHWNNTIPNKIFDYMSAGIPVVVSDAIPVRRIVEETGCGLWYPDTDGAALAQRLVQLEDGAVRERYGKSGYQAVVGKYNWQQDSRVLLDSVASLTNHKVA